MNGLHLLDLVMQDGKAPKLDLNAPDAPENKAFLEALLETDALKDSGLSVEDLQAWLANQGGKGLPLGGLELPVEPGAQGREAADAAAFGAQQAELETQAFAERPEPARQGELRELAASRSVSDGADGVDSESLFDMLAFADGGVRRDGDGGGRPDAAVLDMVSRGRNAAQLAQAQADQRAGANATRGEGDTSTEASRFLSGTSSPTINGGQNALGGMPTYQVAQGVGQQGWGQALGERLVMMAQQDVQQARLQMHPRELGPLDVTVQIRDDKATIQFTAQNPVTREALEAELPRLRAMLQEQGIEEAEVHVGGDDARQAAEEQQESRDGLARGDGADGDDGDGASGGGDDGSPVSLIDHYV